MFKVSWTKPIGSRESFEKAWAKKTLETIVSLKLVGTPGLKITDAGGVSLSLDDLAILAAQQDED